MLCSLLVITSGGQTGADRAALDWAIEHGISHAGWCPQGRLAEDGVIDSRYNLKETPSTDYSERTDWNVRNSDGTVIFSINPVLSGGTKTTAQIVRQRRKPLLHLSKGAASAPESELRHFVDQNKITILNVAGPRASEEPEIGAFVKDVLDNAWPQT